MNKLQMIIMFTIPAIRGAANYLRFKDANSEGNDDKCADALDYAASFVEALAYNTPTPDLPKSLRPHISAEGEVAASDSPLVSSAK